MKFQRTIVPVEDWRMIRAAFKHSKSGSVGSVTIGEYSDFGDFSLSDLILPNEEMTLAEFTTKYLTPGVPVV